MYVVGAPVAPDKAGPSITTFVNVVVANISYGFGHSYRNEVTIWGEKAILKTNRVFTRPKNCDVPIQLWNNGKYERYEVENVDHFLGMINSFSDSISNNNDLNNDTLKRMLFVKGLM